MKSSRVASLVRATLALALVVVAVGIWYQKAKGTTSSLGASGQPTKPDQLQKAFSLGKKASGWAGRYAELSPSDLIVMPLNDTTGLRGQWNNEIRDCARRLIPLYAWLAGKELNVPDSWPLYASLQRRGMQLGSAIKLDDAALAKLGRELKTKTIVRLDTSFESSSTVARAKALDSASGQVVGSWSASVACERNATFESLFDAQARLAPLVAAGLCGLKDPRQIAQPASDADSKTALSLMDKARGELAQPVMPRLMKALRFSFEALQRDRHCTDAWITIAMASYHLSQRIGETETPLWQEIEMRAFLAAEVAAFLAPDSPLAHTSRLFGMTATNRWAEALNIAKADLESQPNNWIYQAHYASLWNRPELFPELPVSASPMEEAFYKSLQPWIQAMQKSNGTASLYKRWIAQEGLAPGVCNLLAELQNEQSEIGYARFLHALGGVHGSLLSVCESVRQLEEERQTSAALETALALDKLLELPPLETSDPTSVAEQLEQQLCRWTVKQGTELLPDEDVYWSDDSLPMRLITFSEKARARTAASLTLKPQTNRSARELVTLNRQEWLDLAQRPALDAAAASMTDLAVRLGDPESGLRMGAQLLKLFPEDFALLESHAYYYRSVHFNNSKVDHFQGRMNEINFSYPPMRRRNMTIRSNDPKIITQGLEDLKYWYPFSPKTLGYIVQYLEGCGNYNRAADFAELVAVRFPLSSYARLKALCLRACAESRRVRPQEAAAFEASLGRNDAQTSLQIAEAWFQAGEIDNSLALFESALATSATSSVTPYYRTSWMHRMRGEHELAIQTLEDYVQRDRSSLYTCDVLLEISRIEQWRGNMQGARRALERVMQVESQKGSVIQRSAYLNWVEGFTTAALEEYQRMVSRYDAPGSWSKLGWALLALDQVTTASQMADKALESDASDDSGYWLKSAIARRQGNNDQALQALRDYYGRMPHDAFPQLSFASHYLETGELDQALSHAEQALEGSTLRNRTDILEKLCQICIEKGDLARAEKAAQQLRVLSPQSVSPELLLARIALAKGQIDQAQKLLEWPLRIGSEEVHGVAAKLYLAQKQYEKALEHARRANAMRLYPDGEWLLVEGQAARALGRNEEARKAFERCVQVTGPQTRLGRQAAEQMGK